jgi:hypothetical protein
MASLSSSIFCPHDICPDVQCAVIGAFWPNGRNDLGLIDYAAYFRSLRSTIETLAYPSLDESLFAAQSYQDLIHVVECLRDHPNTTRQQIAHKLHEERFPCYETKQIIRSMELAARLWLMLNIRSRDAPLTHMAPNLSRLEWEDTRTIRDIVGQFVTVSDLPDPRHSRIDKGLTALNLKRMIGVDVQFTNNLLDHLRYDRSRTRLYIYPHKECLLNHQNSPHLLFPRDCLEETVRTLDLLFPFTDDETRNYLERKGQPFFKIYTHDARRADSVADFRYWRLQILELCNLFNSPPQKWHQMWHDRRNTIQWYNFWITVLVGVLTVVTLAFGVVATYGCIVQIRLADMAYQLSLMQLCNDSTRIQRVCAP